MPSWKSDVLHFGVAKSRSLAKAAGDRTPSEEEKILSYRTKENADVCLSCKKSASQCSGGDACFRKRKKQLEKEKETRFNA